MVLTAQTDRRGTVPTTPTDLLGTVPEVPLRGLVTLVLGTVQTAQLSTIRDNDIRICNREMKRYNNLSLFK